MGFLIKTLEEKAIIQSTFDNKLSKCIDGIKRHQKNIEALVIFGDFALLVISISTIRV